MEIPDQGSVQGPNGYSDFLLACRDGDLERVKKLLTEDILVKLQTRRRGNVGVSVCDDNGLGPLHLAAIGGNLNVSHMGIFSLYCERRTSLI